MSDIPFLRLDGLSLLSKAGKRVRFSCLDATPRILALGATTGSVYCFETKNYSLVRMIAPTYQSQSFHEPVSTVKFNQQGNLIAVATKNCVFCIEPKLEDSESRDKEIKIAKIEHSDKIVCLCWTEDGRRLVSADEGGSVILSLFGFTKNLFAISPVFSLISSTLVLKSDSSIVQIAFHAEKCLISSMTKLTILDIATGTEKTVGKATRLGPYGACCTNDHAIYAARPGKRVWKSNVLTCEVEATLKFSVTSSPSTFINTSFITLNDSTAATNANFSFLQKFSSWILSWGGSMSRAARESVLNAATPLISMQVQPEFMFLLDPVSATIIDWWGDLGDIIDVSICPTNDNFQDKAYVLHGSNGIFDCSCLSFIGVKDFLQNSLEMVQSLKGDPNLLHARVVRMISVVISHKNWSSTDLEMIVAMQTWLSSYLLSNMIVNAAEINKLVLELTNLVETIQSTFKTDTIAPIPTHSRVVTPAVSPTIAPSTDFPIVSDIEIVSDSVSICPDISQDFALNPILNLEETKHDIISKEEYPKVSLDSVNFPPPVEDISKLSNSYHNIVAKVSRKKKNSKLIEIGSIPAKIEPKNLPPISVSVSSFIDVLMPDENKPVPIMRKRSSVVRKVTSTTPLDYVPENPKSDNSNLNIIEPILEDGDFSQTNVTFSNVSAKIEESLHALKNSAYNLLPISEDSTCKTVSDSKLLQDEILVEVDRNLVNQPFLENINNASNSFLVNLMECHSTFSINRVSNGSDFPFPFTGESGEPNSIIDSLFKWDSKNEELFASFVTSYSEDVWKEESLISEQLDLLVLDSIRSGDLYVSKTEFRSSKFLKNIEYVFPVVSSILEKLKVTQSENSSADKFCNKLRDSIINVTNHFLSYLVALNSYNSSVINEMPARDRSILSKCKSIFTPFQRLWFSSLILSHLSLIIEGRINEVSLLNLVQWLDGNSSLKDLPTQCSANSCIHTFHCNMISTCRLRYILLSLASFMNIQLLYLFCLKYRFLDFLIELDSYNVKLSMESYDKTGPETNASSAFWSKTAVLNEALIYIKNLSFYPTSAVSISKAVELYPMVLPWIIFNFLDTGSYLQYIFDLCRTESITEILEIFLSSTSSTRPKIFSDNLLMHIDFFNFNNIFDYIAELPVGVIKSESFVVDTLDLRCFLSLIFQDINSDVLKNEMKVSCLKNLCSKYHFYDGIFCVMIFMSEWKSAIEFMLLMDDFDYFQCIFFVESNMSGFLSDRACSLLQAINCCLLPFMVTRVSADDISLRITDVQWIYLIEQVYLKKSSGKMNFSSILRLLITTVSCEYALAILGQLSAEILDIIPDSFYRELFEMSSLNSSVAFHQQEILESLDTHLWTLRSAHLSAQIRTIKNVEVEETCSNLFAGFVNAPSENPYPMFDTNEDKFYDLRFEQTKPIPRCIEEANSHWGIHFTLENSCGFCAIPILDTNGASIVIFRCGHLFHSLCCPEKACSVCYTEISH